MKNKVYHEIETLVKKYFPDAKWIEHENGWSATTRPNRKDKWDEPEDLIQFRKEADKKYYSDFSGSSWDDEGNIQISLRKKMDENKSIKFAAVVKGILQERPDINDPKIMALRAKKDQIASYGKKPSSSDINRWYDALDKLYDKLDEIRELEKELFAEMDSDPDIEVEGGPVADKYGIRLDQLNDISVKVRIKIKEYEDKIQKYKQTFGKK